MEPDKQISRADVIALLENEIDGGSWEDTKQASRVAAIMGMARVANLLSDEPSGSGQARFKSLADFYIEINAPGSHKES